MKPSPWCKLFSAFFTFMSHSSEHANVYTSLHHMHLQPHTTQNLFFALSSHSISLIHFYLDQIYCKRETRGKSAHWTVAADRISWTWIIIWLSQGPCSYMVTAVQDWREHGTWTCIFAWWDSSNCSACMWICSGYVSLLVFGNKPGTFHLFLSSLLKYYKVYLLIWIIVTSCQRSCNLFDKKNVFFYDAKQKWTNYSA